MPFTPAHTAIVLPLLKARSRFISATGLVVGSMSPDFEYFFKMHVKSEFSHSIGGLFYFDVPVTLVIAVLFHEVVKKNLIDNLPAFFQRRLEPLRRSDFLSYFKKNTVAFLVCALVGAASHLFWDNFTHATGFFVDKLPIYKYYVPFQGVRYPMFYALQHFSTGVGLLSVVLYVVWLKTDVSAVTTVPRLSYWVTVIGLTCVIVWTRFEFVDEEPDLGNFVVSVIAATGCALLATGMLKFKSTNA